MNIIAPSQADQYQTDVLVDVLEENDKGWHVVVFNDPINTFEHVINQFQLHCGHTPNQAAQCAMIIHHVGKCSVKEGNQEDMQRIADLLKAQGIDALCMEMEEKGN